MGFVNNLRISYPKAKKLLRQMLSESITHRSFTFPPELKSIDELSNGLRSVNERWPIGGSDVDTVQPVFLFSAGWRSGSTLLQRLLCSSGELVMWGEPLGSSAIIPRMSLSLASISDSWPPDEFFSHHQNLETFSSSWIANVTPEIDALRLAHRAFFDEWLAKSAMDIYGASK